MRALRLVVAVAALAIACKKVPVAGVYCDGTSKWPCSDPAYPKCDLAQKQCVAAGSMPDGALPPDMTPPPPDLAGCMSGADCPDAMPICDQHVCRACAGSGDDAACQARSSATPRCFAASGQCAACAVAGTQSSDCAAATPVCGDGGVCRACAAHAECASELCNLDGTCAAAATVAYADNAGGACTGTHAATLADPACDVTAALAVKPLVRVMGSSAAYPPVSVGSGSVQIVGADTSPSATIAGTSAAPAIAVSGAGTSALLDELEVTSGSGEDGVQCNNGSGSSTLTIRRSHIHDTGGIGVDITRCALTMDRDEVGPANALAGLSIGNGSYTVTNSFIVANTATGVAFGIGATAAGVGFMHDTVVGNSGGGLACTATTTIANSIVEGNGTMNTTGSCTLTSSTTATPDFVSATDWHLAGRTTANLACCIDQIASSPVDHDYDGRARPQPTNGRWDIGAHEVP